MARHPPPHPIPPVRSLNTKISTRFTLVVHVVPLELPQPQTWKYGLLALAECLNAQAQAPTLR